MLSGEYQLEAHADGYVSLSTPLVVSLEKEQTHRFALTPMPGVRRICIYSTGSGYFY